MELNPAGPFSGMLLGILYGINYRDLVIPLCFLFWSLILFVSLPNIELTDGITAGTFVTFSVFSAAIVILAIPRALIVTDGPTRIATVLFTAAMLTVARWLIAYRRLAHKIRLDQQAKRSPTRGKATER